MSEIAKTIVEVGFPVVMCLLIFYSNEKTIKQLEETINRLNITMNKILVKLGIDEEDDK